MSKMRDHIEEQGHALCFYNRENIWSTITQRDHARKAMALSIQMATNRSFRFSGSSDHYVADSFLNQVMNITANVSQT